MYVLLAPGMEHQMGVDPPMENAARCYRYTSSDDDADQVVLTTNERVRGKRLVAEMSSRAGGAPSESAQGPSSSQGSASRA